MNFFDSVEYREEAEFESFIKKNNISSQNKTYESIWNENWVLWEKLFGDDIEIFFNPQREGFWSHLRKGSYSKNLLWKFFQLSFLFGYFWKFESKKKSQILRKIFLGKKDKLPKIKFQDWEKEFVMKFREFFLIEVSNNWNNFCLQIFKNTFLTK